MGVNFMNLLPRVAYVPMHNTRSKNMNLNRQFTSTYHTTAPQSYISYRNNSTDHHKPHPSHKPAYPPHSRYQNIDS